MSVMFKRSVGLSGVPSFIVVDVVEPLVVVVAVVKRRLLVDALEVARSLDSVVVVVVVRSLVLRSFVDFAPLSLDSVVVVVVVVDIAPSSLDSVVFVAVVDIASSLDSLVVARRRSSPLDSLVVAHRRSLSLVVARSVVRSLKFSLDTAVDDSVVDCGVNVDSSADTRQGFDLCTLLQTPNACIRVKLIVIMKKSKRTNVRKKNAIASLVSNVSLNGSPSLALQGQQTFSHESRIFSRSCASSESNARSLLLKPSF